MSDHIKTLPVVKTERFSDSESSRLQPYLSKTCSQTFFGKHKKYLFILAVFIVLSIPIVGSLMNMLTNSWILTLLIKIVLFIVSIFVILKLDG